MIVGLRSMALRLFRDHLDLAGCRRQLLQGQAGLQDEELRPKGCGGQGLTAPLVADPSGCCAGGYLPKQRGRGEGRVETQSPTSSGERGGCREVCFAILRQRSSRFSMRVISGRNHSRLRLVSVCQPHAHAFFRLPVISTESRGHGAACG